MKVCGKVINFTVEYLKNPVKSLKNLSKFYRIHFLYNKFYELIGNFLNLFVNSTVRLKAVKIKKFKVKVASDILQESV